MIRLYGGQAYQTTGVIEHGMHIKGNLRNLGGPLCSYKPMEYYGVPSTKAHQAGRCTYSHIYNALRKGDSVKVSAARENQSQRDGKRKS